MKKLTTTILVFMLSLTMFSQQTEELKPILKTDFNFSGIGFSYEIPIAKKWSLDLSTGLGAGFKVTNNLRGKWVLFESPSMYFKSEVKYLYNREKRAKRNKSILNNSGNYWAFQTKYTTKRFSEFSVFDPASNVLLTEIHWGIQRPLGTKWLFNTHIGLGYARDFTLKRGSFYPGIGLKFSYILF